MAPNVKTYEKQLTKATKDFEKTERLCRADIAAGKVSTAAIAIGQLELVTLDADVVDKIYCTMEEKFPEELQEGEMSVRETLYDTFRDLFTALKKDLIVAKVAFEAVGDMPPPPVLTPAQEAEKIRISRNKVLARMQDSIKRAKETAAAIQPSEILAEVEMLEKELREIHTMWEKTGELAEQLMEADLSQWEIMKKVQETVDTETNKEYFALETDVRKLMAASRKIREQKEIEHTRETPDRESREGSVGSSVATVSSGTKLRLEKIKIPSFNGKIEEYATFKEDWLSIVEPELEEAAELRQIRMQVPVRDRRDVGGFRTMLEVWGFLDQEYGKTDKIVASRVEKLHSFKVSTKAKTDPDKFLELYSTWREIYCDLEKIKQTEQLNNAHALNYFITKFPVSSRKSYISFTEKECNKDKRMGTVLDDWLRKERSTQLSLAEFHNLETGSSDKPQGRKCGNCGLTNHETKDCRRKKKSPQVSNHADGAASKSDCPICKKSHTWKDKKNDKTNNCVRLSSCPEYVNLSVEQRAERIRTLQGCIVCLDRTGRHQGDSCQQKTRGWYKTCELDVNGRPCGKNHHRLLHGSKVAYCNSIRSWESQPNCPTSEPEYRARVMEEEGRAPTYEELEAADYSTVMIPVQVVDVKLAIRSLICFFDSGSNINIVAEGWARRAGLSGIPVVKTVYTAGGQCKQWHTKLYSIPLVKNGGDVVRIVAMGMETITESMERVDHTAIAEFFPNIESWKLTRPHGDVHLLVGIAHAELHPYLETMDNCVGSLRVLKSVFGSGYVLDGSHDRLRPAGGKLVNLVREYTRGRLREETSSPAIKYSPKSVVNLCRVKETFLELEEMGVSQPRRCGTCKNCSRCSVRSTEMTAREQAELVLIEENVKFDQEAGKVTFTYPTIKDTHKLEDNFSQVLAIERKVEAKLLKKGQLNLFNKEVQGYIDRGTFKEIAKHKLVDWSGPRNYISIHNVAKPSSVSTALRVVSNSSLNNNNKGLSYNDCLPKGPNALVPLLEALTAWRCYPNVVCWDYSKCYNSVLTTDAELHCRRFVWRMGEKEEWRIFGINKMHFGDRPAAIGLEIAKNLVAEAGLDVDPAAVAMIKKDYVDDGFGGGSQEDVDRLTGETVSEDGSPKYEGTVARIMRKGGFNIKIMIRSGENRPEILENFGGSILGVPWETEADEIRMKFEVNLSPKVQKIRTGPAIKKEEASTIRTLSLTRRIMLSQIYSVYDPLGLLSPITIKYKLLLQRIVMAGLDWDQELEGELLILSQDVLIEMVEAGDVKFNRSVIPGGGGDIGLVGMSDGGDPASACCLYVRTERKDAKEGEQTHVVRLIAAKARVTPSSQKDGKLRKSTPRCELRGMLLLVRLVTALLNGFPVTPSYVFLATDSECTISAIEAEDKVLQSWFTNRVAEICDHMTDWVRQSLEVDPIHHWPGLQNVADLATKGKAKVEDIMEDSVWQNGPPELSFPREKWPANRSFKRSLPEVELRVRTEAGVCFSTLEAATSRASVRDALLLQEGATAWEPGHTKSKCPRGRNNTVLSWPREQLTKLYTCPTTQPAVVCVVRGDSKLHNLQVVVNKCMSYTNNVEKCVRILARVMAAMTGGRESAKDELTVERLEKARTLINIVSAFEVTPRVHQLANLDPYLSAGVWRTQGRMRKGNISLQILFPDQRLAVLEMQRAHEEDHEESPGTLARSLTEEDLVPLTINQLLLGRNSNQAITYDPEGNLTGLDGIVEKHKQVLSSWWKLWKEQSFAHILPFRRAKEAHAHEDVKVGDICLLKYTTKVSSHYRLCIVVHTDTSMDGCVRTVKVSLKNRRGKVNSFLKNDIIEVGVQRLSVVMKVGEYTENKSQE